MSFNEKLWLIHIFFDFPVLIICIAILWSHRDALKREEEIRIAWSCGVKPFHVHRYKFEAKVHTWLAQRLMKAVRRVWPFKNAKGSL